MAAVVLALHAALPVKNRYRVGLVREFGKWTSAISFIVALIRGERKERVPSRRQIIAAPASIPSRAVSASASLAPVSALFSETLWRHGLLSPVTQHDWALPAARHKCRMRVTDWLSARLIQVNVLSGRLWRHAQM
jgi:hypothetical protein